MARTLNWVTPPPATAKKGRVITPPPEIEILADGVRENVSGPVSLSGSGLLGTLTQQAAEGLVAFPDLSFSQLGNIQLDAACDEANLVVPAPARPTTWRVNYLSGGNYDPLVGENVFWKTGSTSGSSSATFVWTVCIAKDASGFTVQAPGGSVDFVMGTTKTASGEPADVSSVMAYTQQSWAINPNGGGLSGVQIAFTPPAGTVMATDAPGLGLAGAWAGFAAPSLVNFGDNGVAAWAISGAGVAAASSEGPTGSAYRWAAAGTVFTDVVGVPWPATPEWSGLVLARSTYSNSFGQRPLILGAASNDDGSNGVFTLDWTSGRPRLKDGPLSAPLATLTAPAASLSVWVLIGARSTANGAGGRDLTLFVNGVAVASGTGAGSGIAKANAGAILGRTNSGADLAVAGAAVWRRALSDAEMLEQARRCGVAA